MKYYIGIDGGATKTHCVIVNEKGEQLHECFGGPSNFLIIGHEKVCQTIFDEIVECKEKLGIKYKDIECILLGTTGAGRITDATGMKNAFLSFVKEKNVGIRNFFVESDARVALEGAFPGKPGCILIAGTGSIMFGKDPHGKMQRVGGFGRLIGDEGSGYALGKHALNNIGRAIDGRGPSTLMTNLVAEKFKMNMLDDIVNEVYVKGFDIPQVAPIVMQAANQNDRVALDIIEQESTELVKHIEAMYKRLHVEFLDLTLVGSLITSDNKYSSMLREKIKKALPKIRFKKGEHSPAYGAALLAKEQIV